MQQPQALAQSNWRYFPWAVAGVMGIVIAVNVTMAVLATRTFPGNVGSDGFTLSNRYNEVIQTARRDRNRGWTVAAEMPDGRPRILPRDAAGKALAGAQVSLSARRPLGDVEAIDMPVARDAAGAFTAAMPLPEPGQWDLTISVTANGETETVTQRVIRK